MSSRCEVLRSARTAPTWGPRPTTCVSGACPRGP
jgi:hypothetical protein